MNRADRFYAMFPGTEHTRIDSVLRNFPDSVSDEQIASTLRLVLGIHDEAYEKMSYDHLGEGDETQGASTACSAYDEEAQATFLWMLEELLRVEERERAIQDEDEGYTREQIASLYADAQRSLSSGRGGVRGFLKRVFRGEAVSACAQIIPGVHHIGGSATTSLSTGSNPDTRARSKSSNCVPPSCSGATTRNTFEVTQALRAAATDVATFHTSASGHCPPEPERCARLEQAVVQDAWWGGALPAQEGPSTSQRFDEFSMGAQPMDFEGLMRQFQGGETSTLPNVGKVRSNTRTPNATFGTEEQLDPQKTADEFKAMLQGFY